MADNVTIDGVVWRTKDVASAHIQVISWTNEAGAFIAVAEDTAAADGTFAVPVMAKRRDADTSDVGTDGDWARFLVGSLGGLKVQTVAPALVYPTPITRSTAGTTAIVAAQGAGVKIKVVGYQIVCDVPNGVHLHSGATSITGLMELGRGIVRQGDRENPVLETTANAALNIETTGAGVVTVAVCYIAAT